MAARKMVGQPPNHTLSPTALLHEAYMRVDAGDKNWHRDRTYLFRAFAGEMRRTLIDSARRRRALKRGHGKNREALSALDLPASRLFTVDEFIDLDDALEALKENDPRAYSVFELRCFAGLTFRETAGNLDISETTAKEDWAYAVAWVKRKMDSGRP